LGIIEGSLMIPLPTSSQFRDVKMATGNSSWHFIPISAEFIHHKQKLFEARYLLIKNNPQELQNLLISKKEESDSGIYCIRRPEFDPH
jgi:hypothetical protein